jgi:hypothetical protein
LVKLKRCHPLLKSLEDCFIFDIFIFTEYQYTNGDVGREQGGATTPTQSPLPELAVDNQMVYPFESSNSIGKS